MREGEYSGFGDDEAEGDDEREGIRSERGDAVESELFRGMAGRSGEVASC
jgi:hypothetical protein